MRIASALVSGSSAGSSVASTLRGSFEGTKILFAMMLTPLVTVAVQVAHVSRTPEVVTASLVPCDTFDTEIELSKYRSKPCPFSVRIRLTQTDKTMGTDNIKQRQKSLDS